MFEEVTHLEMLVKRLTELAHVAQFKVGDVPAQQRTVTALKPEEISKNILFNMTDGADVDCFRRMRRQMPAA